MNDPEPSLRRVDLEAGDEVERYVVDGVINSGGMGTVYRVHHTSLRTRHALKIPHDQTVSMRARLVQEGRAQAHLQHSNILRVTDVVNLPGGVGIGLVADYVDGEDMEVWLARRPPWTERLRLFNQVVDAVAFAHEHGFLHRDLKPANVLVGRDRVARVADFGLTKVLIDELRILDTHTAASMGTLRYSAPEQLTNAKHVDARADVWSLGCMLYELVCFRPPFEGDTPTEILRRELSGDLIPPEQHVAGLPPAVVAAIRGAIQIEVEDRFPNVEAFAAVLRQATMPTPTLDPMDVVVPARLNATIPPGSWGETDEPAPPPVAAPAPRSRVSWVVVALTSVVAAVGFTVWSTAEDPPPPAGSGALAAVGSEPAPPLDEPEPDDGVAPELPTTKTPGMARAPATGGGPKAQPAPASGHDAVLATHSELPGIAALDFDLSGLAPALSVRIETRCGERVTASSSSAGWRASVPACSLGAKLYVTTEDGEATSLLGPIDGPSARYRCSRPGRILTCEPLP